MQWKVTEAMDIYSFIQKNTTFSSKQVKQFLKFENVFVNQRIVTNVHYELSKNDIVELIEKKNISDLVILYEDKELIVVDKPANLLTIATEKEKNRTLYHMVSSYIKKNHKQGKIYIVHRLDKETSGIVIFAKNEKAKLKLQNDWENTKRYYQAIVHGKMKKKQDILKTYLKEDQHLRVTAAKDGKLAITEYTVMHFNNRYSYLNIQIYTGRKNQIRYQLQEIQHPIVGDHKYGNLDKEKRLYLHAYKIEFTHPQTNKLVVITSPIPKEFTTLFKNT